MGDATLEVKVCGWRKGGVRKHIREPVVGGLGVIEDACAGANYGFVVMKGPPCQTQTRTEIVPVGLVQVMRVAVQPGIHQLARRRIERGVCVHCRRSSSGVCAGRVRPPLSGTLP